jgi:hypothetical protein
LTNPAKVSDDFVAENLSAAGAGLPLDTESSVAIDIVDTTLIGSGSFMESDSETDPFGDGFAMDDGASAMKAEPVRELALV